MLRCTNSTSAILLLPLYRSAGEHKAHGQGLRHILSRRLARASKHEGTFEVRKLPTRSTSKGVTSSSGPRHLASSAAEWKCRAPRRIVRRRSCNPILACRCSMEIRSRVKPDSSKHCASRSSRALTRLAVSSRATSRTPATPLCDDATKALRAETLRNWIILLREVLSADAASVRRIFSPRTEERSTTEKDKTSRTDRNRRNERGICDDFMS